MLIFIISISFRFDPSSRTKPQIAHYLRIRLFSLPFSRYSIPKPTHYVITRVLHFLGSIFIVFNRHALASAVYIGVLTKSSVIVVPNPLAMPFAIHEGHFQHFDPSLRV